ncbi:60Kd inner membrane protein-domain-containing protein [Sparassis latifolia]|uniref:Membrane insertase YidC/Oxa/ALB C-terminal domain-containing protein n=1 Tax=Sparassis crispa TaxID=139825 RepID=A0A401GBY1_9APHY|nr:hypothetical protein SCP_0208880 [Sparassis crispa]GBE79688.1 hypothetical protein SCP_0208880 [Sparassis crispa]
MLATRTALRSSSRYSAPTTKIRHECSSRASRTFISAAVQGLSEQFLDLAIALPLPPSLPPYSTTILLVTVVSRLIFTVPFSVWAKNRQWKAENLVAPQLQQEAPQMRQKVIDDMKRGNYRGDSDEAIKKEMQKRARALLKTRRAELNSLHGCSPIPTVVIPPLTQLPLFVGFSMMLSRISHPPTVLDSESFFTLTSLAHSDPTVTLPIVLGLVTLANVESAHWFLSATALERQKKVEQWTADRRAKGEVVVEPRKIVQTALRSLSIARILIAAVVPGTIQLYWVASASFGLVQTWIFDWYDARRARRLTQSRPSGLPKSHSINS